MGVYTVNRASVALNTSQDTLTIVAAAAKPLRVMVVDIKGMGTASASNQILLARSSGGSTPGGAVTPRGTTSDTPSAGFAVYTSWSVQPTLGNELWRFGVNANGGQDKFTALPGAEISVPGGGQVSLRSVSGTSDVVVDLLVEEIGG